MNCANYLQTIFDYDDGKLFWKISPTKNVKIGDRAGNSKADGYRYITLNKKTYKEHRLIYKLLTGLEPDIIDHINNEPSDNKIDNLRSVNTSINGKNRVCLKKPKSGHNHIVYQERPGRNPEWIVKMRTLEAKTYSKMFHDEKSALDHRNEKYIEFGYLIK